MLIYFHNMIKLFIGGAYHLARMAGELMIILFHFMMSKTFWVNILILIAVLHIVGHHYQEIAQIAHH